MKTRQPAVGSAATPVQAEVDSLQRGLEILRSFRAGEKSLRLADIVARTKMPRLTALKLLNTLTAHRFLRHLPDLDRYEPDVSCSVLGHALRASLPILRVGGPIMQAFADKLEVDAFLAVPERMDMMVLEYCSTRPEAAEYNVGSLVPIAQTAAGRAWLFAQRPAVQGDFIERLRMEADERGVNAIPAIYRSFQDLAERGYCYSAGDRMGNRHSIATPLILSDTRKVFALAALASKPYSKEAFLQDTVAPALMDAAVRIKTEMRDQEA